MTIQADNPAREPAPVGAPEGQPSEPVRTEEDALLDELRGPEEEPNDEGEPQTPAEIEIERNGKKYKIHPDLKDGFLQHDDYTRKTQGIAKEKGEFQAERETFKLQVQAAEKTLAQRGAVGAIDMQLAEFSKIDWAQLNASDPQQFNAYRLRQEQLMGQRQTLVNEINRVESESVHAQRQEFAKRKQETRDIITREIKGWTDEADNRMVADAVKYYPGLQATEELFRLGATNATAYRILWDAVALRRAQEKISSAPKPAPVQQAEPIVPATKVSGRGASARPGLHDGLSIEEWNKRRDAQVTARSRR